MSDRVLKVALYSIGSTLLLLIITIPLIAMLWISGIQYHSRWNILLFIAMITIFDLLAEYIGRMAVDGFASLFSWPSKKRLLFRYILDFFMTLLITHFVDEYFKGVSLSTGGEIIFAILILLFTAVLEMNTNDEKEA
ncbi:hypothetical protein J0J80_01290 [Turicibacter bilis]|uniref:YrvL family regulatory protein n=1 Tax=Turicibacter bilis TaxID=2735723 RepID=UPI0006C36D6B|nr:YrvL family regulatory protein [Turicibacter bilis]MBS3203665.1 hypothetical protein [Turicibacter bilis]UUF11052.1 hypothetical protein J0J80_01290 [Turicibacter bilis]CUN86440.1 Uncharacterised protein [Turicibacter sanguinis]